MILRWLGREIVVDLGAKLTSGQVGVKLTSGQVGV